MTFCVRAPTDELLEMFRQELWKEQRKLEVVGPCGNLPRRLRKHCISREAVAAELECLEVVRRSGMDLVPRVFGHGDTYFDLEYIEGTRVHNVLAILKSLAQEDARARSFHRRLVARCVTNCSVVQSALMENARATGIRLSPYPVRRKLLWLMRLFDHCLELGLDMDSIEAEAVWAETYLDMLPVALPFRDAAPKNLILVWPEMWRGRITNNEQRLKIGQIIRDSPGAYSPIDDAQIIHVDFSSCNELTVPEDDPISLLLHESCWMGRMPRAASLLWQPIMADPVRLAVGLVIRMYRLGGRRLSYNLIHCSGYEARYGEESTSFYFDKLLAAKSLCPELRRYFPCHILAAERILGRINEGLHSESDWFSARYRPSLKHYYRDIYPY